MKRAPYNASLACGASARSLTIASPPHRHRFADVDSADSATPNFGADSADSATPFFLSTRVKPGRRLQISPAIGELALAYIRFAIRPAR